MYCKRLIVALAILVFLGIFLVVMVAFQGPAKDLSSIAPADSPFKVGQIFVVGNEITPDQVIRNELNLYPGMPFSPEQLRTAENNLAKLGLFRIDPAAQIAPKVIVLDPDGVSEFKDILVQVEEKPGFLIRRVPIPFILGSLGLTVLGFLLCLRIWWLAIKKD